jgi:hypothetical protein
VTDDAVSALESTLADLGELVVQTDKFRPVAGVDTGALRRACIVIGDRARRAHRHGGLGPALGAELLADATAVRTALHAALRALRSSPAYLTAAAALAAGDDATLRASLAAVFEGTGIAPPPETLHLPVAWQRRGRPRPASDVALELAALRTDGVRGDGDPAAPGVDPDLPGVTCSVEPPPGQPVFLVADGPARPAWVLTLPNGDVVVPGVRVRLPFTVVLADPATADLDEWAMDPVTLRDDLAAALAARGLPVARR